MKKTVFLTTFNKVIGVHLFVTRYHTNKRLCILLRDAKTNAIICSATVNMPDEDIPDYHAAILHNAENAYFSIDSMFIVNGIGMPVGKTKSIYSSHPIFRFNREKLAECDPEGMAEYEESLKEKK